MIVENYYRYGVSPVKLDELLESFISSESDKESKMDVMLLTSQPTVRRVLKTLAAVNV